ncbi:MULTISPECIES: GNAT family N-acetyltransferase [unclassified Halomonas]|uniref:GNAT family N-acetyltransferase n=1 Tax=unclassified Halomonas TaxID=2609666 RepID=UPI002883D66B|nr:MULTISPECIES: GNAT family N-acetyltransferase [unclassified Halomonas]MDT0499428.1 GNAT family N-acetyltransferase [Halomonas sp. PAR7]MDT0510755.1 GNAT family N-acetyltransferase [Halomonas sp. LES1]MDT0591716.1 GNAT family N-acetyltransferase [Halomonas sp. PAR8]
MSLQLIPASRTRGVTKKRVRVRAGSSSWNTRVLAPSEHSLYADELRRLTHEEQARQQGELVHGIDLDAYVTKILEKADIAVLIVDGHLAGFCAFYTYDPGRPSAFITLLLLASEGRRGGMARSLLEATAALAVARGFDCLTLQISHRDWPAIRFYLRQGFRESGRYGRDLEMCLDLTGAFSLEACPRRYSASGVGR